MYIVYHISVLQKAQNISQPYPPESTLRKVATSWVRVSGRKWEIVIPDHVGRLAFKCASKRRVTAWHSL